MMSAIRLLESAARALRDGKDYVAGEREKANQIDSEYRRKLAEVDQDKDHTDQWKSDRRAELRRDAVQALQEIANDVNKRTEGLTRHAQALEYEHLMRHARHVPARPTYAGSKEVDPEPEVLNLLVGLAQRQNARDVPDDAIPREIAHAMTEGDAEQKLAAAHVWSREVGRRNLRDLPGHRARQSVADSLAAIPLPDRVRGVKSAQTIEADARYIAELAESVRLGRDSQSVQYAKRMAQDAIRRDDAAAD